MADYTGVLRRRWPIILVVLLIGLIGAFGYVTVAKKSYSSTAQVYVTATGADLASSASGSRTQGAAVNLDTEAQIVTSAAVAQIAGKMMHSTQTPYQLKKNISVTVPSNSEVLNITCSAPTSDGAATCANDFAAAYLQNRSSTSAAFVAAQLTPLQAKVSSLQKSDASLNATIASLPSNSSQRLTAQAQLTSNTSQLTNLNGQVAALYSDASKTNGGHVTSPAGPSGTASSPKKSLILPSGGAAGLIIGLIAAFLWDRRDKRIHNVGDAERLLNLPILLDLPKAAVGRSVTLATPRSRTGRAFTELAHTMAASLGEGSHVVLVAGVTSGPAVSIVAANLAAALARTHSEAVLVCAALRDSVAPQMFGLPEGRGLAEVVAGRATVGEVARGPASAPGLWVIPPGADTSLAEYNLQHDTAKALTSQLRRDARYIIIEAQAREDGADTFALAEFSDTAVLTVEAQRTTKPEAESCMRRLARMHTPVLGLAVLPPVKSGISVRPPQPVQQRAAAVGGDHRPEPEARRDTTSLGRSSLPPVAGAAAGSQPEHKPGRARDTYDPADHVPGN
jgi:capsular polysaccharide biosynthesis protein